MTLLQELQAKIQAKSARCGPFLSVSGARTLPDLSQQGEKPKEAVSLSGLKDQLHPQAASQHVRLQGVSREPCDARSRLSRLPEPTPFLW
jgi:hypothetical protein